jgi:hypothetical protein
LLLILNSQFQWNIIVFVVDFVRLTNQLGHLDSLDPSAQLSCMLMKDKQTFLLLGLGAGIGIGIGASVITLANYRCKPRTGRPKPRSASQAGEPSTQAGKPAPQFTTLCVNTHIDEMHVYPIPKLSEMFESAEFGNSEICDESHALYMNIINENGEPGRTLDVFLFIQSINLPNSSSKKECTNAVCNPSPCDVSPLS